MNKIDLHLHTCDSDGYGSFEELVADALMERVDYLTLTNHDTLTLNRFEYYKKIAASAGIALEFPGAEVSVLYRASGLPLMSFDLLCYGWKLNSPYFAEILETGIDSEFNYYQHLVDKITNQYGASISVRELSVYQDAQGIHPKTRITRDAVAQTLAALTGQTERGIKDQMPKRGFLDLHVEASTVLNMVKELGGASVLAHPARTARYHKLSPVQLFEVLDDLKHMGLQGIEVQHPSHDEVSQDVFSQISEKLELIPFGGSDYHRRVGEFLGCFLTSPLSFEALLRIIN